MSLPRPRRSRLLVGVVLAVVLVGTVVSVLAAFGRSDEVMGRRRSEFERSTADLSTALTTSLLRNADIVASAGAYLAASEEVYNFEFEAWYERAAAGRYPGLLAFAFVQRVPAADLDDYVEEQRVDPGVLTPGPFRLSPSGLRAEYCLPRLTAGGEGAVVVEIPPGVDLCAVDEELAASLRRVADRGDVEVLPLLTSPAALGDALSDEARQVSGSTFMLAKAVYGGPAATVAERRANLLGWVIAPFDGPTIASGVLGDRDDAGIRLTWVGDSPVVVAERPAGVDEPLMVEERTIDADGRWTVQLAQPSALARAAARSDLWVVLATGLVLTALVAALFAVLLGARNHALRLVDHKTDELRHQALHDSLTGLPNRVLVLDRAEQLLARGRRQDRAPVAMFVDVDHFKRINDTLGHAAGDTVLRIVADRIRSVVRGADTVGRLGGDEFVVLADGASVGNPETLAQRVLETMAEPIVLDAAGGVPVTVGVSIGIAVGDRRSADELLRDADLALYRAKEDGRSCFVQFDEDMQAAVQDRLDLEMDLYRAVDEGQLRLVYQPTVSLADTSVTGVEALLRWDHPTRGVVAPMTFIPVAEENGSIQRIGAWVLGEACRQAAEWHANGHRVAMAVNVSVRQLDTDDIVDLVRDALGRTGLPPGSLVLEVTESALMSDPDATAVRLATLKALGVRVAIDDFGTGYSSLAYLQRFPVDTLKIDRSFVTRMNESPESKALVHTLVRLGKTLGIETFAEGIEDADQLRQLRDEACDAGQGYLFARPLDPADLEAFLAAHPVRAPVASGLA